MGIFEKAWDSTNRREDEKLLIAGLADFNMRSQIREHLYHLNPDDFFNPAYGHIWSVARELADEDRIVTLAPFRKRLTDEEYRTLASLEGASVRKVEVERGIQYVRDAARQRRALDAMKQSTLQIEQSETFDDVLGVMHTLVDQLDADEISDDHSTMAELSEQFWVEVETPPERPKAICTPWPDFNKILGGRGLGRKRLSVVAAGTGVGKSIVMLNCALEAALHGMTVAVFSLEMSRQEVYDRLLANLSNQLLRNIEGRHVSDDFNTINQMNAADYEQVAQATKQLAELPIHIFDQENQSPDWIRAKCVALQRSHGLDLIVIDYLQILVTEKIDSREQAVSRASWQLKNLAKAMNAAVLTGSQINKSERGSDRPTTASIRESEGIANNSDLVFFAVPELEGDQKTGMVELVIAKQRNGGAGYATVVDDGPRARFKALDR